MKNKQEKKENRSSFFELLFGKRKKKKEKRAPGALHIGCLCVAIALVLCSFVFEIVKKDVPSQVESFLSDMEEGTGKSVDELWEMFQNGDFEGLESAFTEIESKEVK